MKGLGWKGLKQVATHVKTTATNPELDFNADASAAAGSSPVLTVLVVQYNQYNYVMICLDAASDIMSPWLLEICSRILLSPAEERSHTDLQVRRFTAMPPSSASQLAVAAERSPESSLIKTIIQPLP